MPERVETKVSIPLPAFLPESYVNDTEERMDIYRRIAAQAETGGIDEIGEELRDRFGPMPEPALSLLALVGLRLRAAAAGIVRAELEGKGTLLVEFAVGMVPPKEALGALAGEFEGRIAFDTLKGLRVRIGADRSGAGPRGPEPGRRPRSAADDLEKILNLLEFYAT